MGELSHGEILLADYFVPKGFSQKRPDSTEQML